MPAIHWGDIVGTCGVTMIVCSYLLLHLGRVNSCSVAFSIANAVGAALILVSLTVDFNLPAAIVESFWLVISLYGVIRNRRSER